MPAVIPIIRLLRKLLTNLTISNYKKNMILTTSAIHNAYGCFNYWCEGCWSCIFEEASLIFHELTCLTKAKEYLHLTYQLVEDLALFPGNAVVLLRNHYMADCLDKNWKPPGHVWRLQHKEKHHIFFIWLQKNIDVQGARINNISMLKTLTVSKSKARNEVILIKYRKGPSKDRYCMLVWVWCSPYWVQAPAVEWNFT